MIPQLKILVAEDTPFNQKYIMRMLERWGHNALLVENGRQVLEALPYHNFDVILMDVRMPEMDGYEATKAIRRAERGKDRHIPIVAMTAHAIKGDRERCLDAGMDEYLSKPISSSKLLDILEDIVRARGGERRAPVDLEKNAGFTGTEQSVDKQMLKDAFDNDWGFFREVVELFVTDYPRMLVRLREALKENDPKTFSRTAHSIKGMVNLFQAEEAMNLALRLETRGRNADLSGIAREIDKLESALEMLKKTLLELSAELWFYY